MKYAAGDLVEVNKRNMKKYQGVIVSGKKVSLYVEARPIKIVDETMYTILSGGKDMFAYEYQIRKIDD